MATFIKKHKKLTAYFILSNAFNTLFFKLSKPLIIIIFLIDNKKVTHYLVIKQIIVHLQTLFERGMFNKK
ncbi:hypothetical protein ACFQ1R_04525 [Mariniflexile jejuense]|uniref:Uncharacterized protein n=1 Tax=Mariniflexile jejuense TaxID=1173582 RepID=A0ABW3JFX9_9FLAO